MYEPVKKRGTFSATPDMPNYNKFKHCRPCRKNHPMNLKYCPNCGRQLAFRPKVKN